MKHNSSTKVLLRLISSGVVLAMLFSFAACSKKDETPEDTTVPAAAEQSLPAGAEDLGDTSLTGWRMEADAWSSSNGATVTFTATPKSYTDGQSVVFTALLDEIVVDEAECTWDGTEFTASLDLEAADGYAYRCTITAAGGDTEVIPLSGPDNLIYDSLVYMKNSLTAYCNLFVADWSENSGKLDITSGYVQVQLPQIQPKSSAVGYESAQLVLSLNGEQVEAQSITLPKGEGMGSYESALTSVSFQMPAMQDDYQLDLKLTVTLSDGQVISADGCSWYFNSGKLNMASVG